jgi:hypothetical protein
MRAATSPVLDALHRPVNPESRVESEERIRCVMMNALEEALASAPPRGGDGPVSASLPVVIRMPEPRPNPFLTPRLDTDPPPPWTGTVRSAARTTKRRRRRGTVPFVLLALALLGGIGLCLSARARSAALGVSMHVGARLSAHGTSLRAGH